MTEASGLRDEMERQMALEIERLRAELELSKQDEAATDAENERLRAGLRELVDAIDAEVEASKRWHVNPASGEEWDSAGRQRSAAMDLARRLLGEPS